MGFTIRPLTPELWPALEGLFGKHGTSNGCWCMYWRSGGAYRERPRDENKAAFREVVKQGPPQGLLAFDGDIVIGWCQLTPRTALPWQWGRLMKASYATRSFEPVAGTLISKDR